MFGRKILIFWSKHYFASGIVNLGAVEDQDAMADFGVKGFPSIKFMGDSMDDYQGPRTADGIVDYILKQVRCFF